MQAPRKGATYPYVSKIPSKEPYQAVIKDDLHVQTTPPLNAFLPLSAPAAPTLALASVVTMVTTAFMIFFAMLFEFVT